MATVFKIVIPSLGYHNIHLIHFEVWLLSLKSWNQALDIAIPSCYILKICNLILIRPFSIKAFVSLYKTRKRLLIIMIAYKVTKIVFILIVIASTTNMTHCLLFFNVTRKSLNSFEVVLQPSNLDPITPKLV